MASSFSQTSPELSPPDGIPLQLTPWSILTSGLWARPPRASHGQMPALLCPLLPSLLRPLLALSLSPRTHTCIRLASRPFPAPALCTSGQAASSLMCSLIGWLWANDNSSLLLPSRPRCPLSSQNTHSALLSSSPVSQPPLYTLEEGFSELVDRIFGFRQIELGLGFKSWLNRTSSPRQPLEVGRPTYCACPTCFEYLEICDAKRIGTALRRLGTCFPMSVTVTSS